MQDETTKLTGGLHYKEVPQETINQLTADQDDLFDTVCKLIPDHGFTNVIRQLAEIAEFEAEDRCEDCGSRSFELLSLRLRTVAVEHENALHRLIEG